MEWYFFTSHFSYVQTTSNLASPKLGKLNSWNQNFVESKYCSDWLLTELLKFSIGLILNVLNSELWLGHQYWSL